MLIWEFRFFFLCMLPRIGVSGRESILKCSSFVLKSNNVAVAEFEHSETIRPWALYTSCFCCCLTFSWLPKVLEATASEITAGFFCLFVFNTKSEVCPQAAVSVGPVGAESLHFWQVPGGSSVGAVGQETTLCQLLLYVIWVFPRVHGPELGTQCALNKCWLVHCI